MSLRPSIVLVTLMVSLLAGCSNLPFQKHDQPMLDNTPPTPVPKIAVVDDSQPIKLKTSETAKVADAKIEKGNGTFVNEAAARLPPPNAVATTGDGQISFNFENTPIQAVAQNVLGALLHENYTIAPNVTGNVTFSTSRPITPEQAMPILEMLLSWTNNALVRKEGRYEVLPVKDAIPGNLTPRIAPPKMALGYEVRVFPLKYISATEMQKLLKPYAKADAVVNADASRNMLIMAGTASELANYQRTIDVFDVDWLKGMSVGVYNLRNTDVTKVQPELDKIFGEAGQSPLAGMFRFIPMDTTNSIIVITSQPDYLKQAEQWLYRLDLGAGENGTQLYVYDVKNVKAADLSDHLNAIYTGQVSQRSTQGNVAPGLRSTTIGGTGGSGLGGGLGGAGGSALGGSSLLGNSLSSNRTTSGAYTNGSTSGSNRTGGVSATGSNLSTTGTGATNAANQQKQSDIRITAIEENNQLLVMATPGEWDSILAAIRRLDIAPLQVQIEAKILEVTLSGDLTFGVQWWLAGLINNVTPSGSTSSTGYQYGRTLPNQPGYNFQGNPADRHRASLGGTGVSPNGGTGFFYSYLNKDFQVAINSLQTSSQTKVLSAPSLFTMNNQPAQITVGTQVPILSTSILTGISTVDSTSANTGIGSTSYISTGVSLSITPRVNPGGLVYMDITQEDSVPGAIVGNNPNPPISQRNIATQVAVQSGQTVLLGGIIEDNTTSSKTSVPILGSIPIIGNLFGNTDKRHDRTELIVLITPRVVVNSDDAVLMTEEYEKKFESLTPIHTASPPAAVAQPIAVPEKAPLPPPTPLPEPQLPENLKDRPNEH